MYHMSGTRGEWDDNSLLWHLKATPERFLKTMHIMSGQREMADRKAFALFPLRHHLVPRHIHFCQKCLRDLLKLGASEHTKAKAKEKRDAKRRKGNDGALLEVAPRARRNKEDLMEEKAEVFNQVIDIRAAKLQQRQYFDWAFSTDGMCARLKCRKPGDNALKKGEKVAPLLTLPKRGLFAINELKRVSRLEALHVVGIDPGIREIIVAVDQDDPKGTTPVRYTQRQRSHDIRTRQYADEGRREKPDEVRAAEQALSDFSSRASSLSAFGTYCAERHRNLDECLAFYAPMAFRHRRWKKYIKTQQSEERLFARLRAIHKKGDERTLVLAYGAWGATTGTLPAGVKKGNPPTIGVGLMRKLAKRFVVSLTPEHHTSKTCCKCMAPAGPWVEKEAKWGKKVRGLRVCQDERCKLPQNRDRMGAANIGHQFRRLFDGLNPIKQMSDEERAFHALNVACIECD